MFVINSLLEQNPAPIITPSSLGDRNIPIDLSLLAISPSNSSRKCSLYVEAEKNQALLEQIHKAILDGAPERVKAILQSLSKDVRKALVNAFDKGGNTSSLHLCATTGNIQIMKLLLEYGANPSMTNNKGSNFVHELLLYKQFKMLSAFFQLVPKRVVKELVNAVDGEGDSSLFYRYTYPSVVYLLLDAGANPLQTNAKKETILHKIAMMKTPILLKTVLNRISKDYGLSKEEFEKLVNARDSDEDTPLLICCKNGGEKCAQLLLDAGADVWICDKYTQFA